jgi:molecular chaperone DnaK (HSP70)
MAAQIEVKPTYGLTDEQVESMILDSFDNAEADFAKRLLIEARNEAETILAAVERAPENPAWNQLTGDEQTAIKLASDYLNKVKQTEDSAAIREATLILDHATRRFAELMMEAAVSSALRGKTMNTVGEELAETVTAPHEFAPAEFK